MRKTFGLMVTLVVAFFIWSQWKNRWKSSTEFAPYYRPTLAPVDICPADVLARSVPRSFDFPRGGHEEFVWKSQARVLLIHKTSFSSASKAINELLVANRIKYKSTVAGKHLPDLIRISKNVGRFGAVVFEDINDFLEMDPWNRELLEKYCRTFNVGLISFFPLEESSVLQDKALNRAFPVKLHLSDDHVTDMSVNATSTLLRLVKGGQILSGEVPDSANWVTFEYQAGFSPVAFAKQDGAMKPIVIQTDHDIIPKVYFGGNMSHWLMKLLFLDALAHVSRGRISVPLTRFILVDIDDVFVTKNRFLPEDVIALKDSQERIRKMVDGFTYNLGFSGGTFRPPTATDEELAGDDLVLTYNSSFWWFPHMWRHKQAHLYESKEELVAEMELNKKFAEEKGMDVSNGYSVAPHHSGVYPVQEMLYEAWKEVWKIEVTSTEEYPHLYPARLRRGFHHSGIQVLPRQTCGLFSKNLYYHEYPKGPEVLEKSIRGGELFQTIVYNPISIFMTHMPNYVLDRLAPYTFESVIQMVKCWTNLELKTRSPKEIAKIYFNMFPEEKAPIWGNYCEDHRHLDIWPHADSCNQLPELLVIGPQKTGTTALYAFLKLHPSIKSNKQSPDSFEELQFFSGSDNYEKGVDWYMQFFADETPDNSSSYLFEKSATYFDHDLAPIRAHRLLKKAKVVTILISPAKRAYSWYHHMRSHDDPTAMQFSFHDVITANENAPKNVKHLQQRCLEPGKYSTHLERWMSLYKSQQIMILDGEELKFDPVSVMNRLQHFLDVKPFVDYSQMLRYDKKKGFFCPVSGKCLGKGKGRHYSPMTPDSVKYLRNYYRLHNEALLKLMKRLGYSTPEWLEEDLKDWNKNGTGNAVVQKALL